VTDAGLVTVIIGLAMSLILIVIGGFSRGYPAITARQNVGTLNNRNARSVRQQSRPSEKSAKMFIRRAVKTPSVN
jgi:hypothetical protein